MWCASRFGVGYLHNFGPCEIDIAEANEQREFDFHLLERNDRLPFQLAEVLEKDRRRGDEYRDRTVEQVNELHNERPAKDDGYRPERASVSLHSYTIESMEHQTPMKYHVQEHLHLGQSAVVKVDA